MGGLKVCVWRGSRCVFQQGAAWPYSLMAADIYCPCLLWNPKTSWGEKNQPKPSGFGVLCRWAPHPRRFESALPEVELVPSAVQQKAGITGVEWSGAPAETHLLFFFFFIKNFEYATFRSPSDWEWMRVRPFSHHPPLVLMVITTKGKAPRRARATERFQIEARTPDRAADFLGKHKNVNRVSIERRSGTFITFCAVTEKVRKILWKKTRPWDGWKSFRPRQNNT